MDSNSVHAALLELLERGRVVQQEWLADLSAAQREAVGTAESWSAKDTLAHFTFWERNTADRVAAARQGATPPQLGEENAVNGEVFEAQRERSWDEVIADADTAYAALTAEVRAADAALLTDPERFAWQGGRPLTLSVLGNGFWHPLEHMSRFYLAHGNLERATTLQQGVALSDAAMRWFPGGRGTALYNLACFYATTAQPEQALALLPEALSLSPDLVEWSKQDSDLDSLRDDPAFQALYRSQ
jgi:hypothetical protein